ncbi:hypothetical protein [Clostridium tyrobutyricum]|uniref:hypothetical protein n=1 Tax=Clostridium tyrobutyricum TaxID=1519 RepID=UPI001C3E5CEA|nr:hypothetical protein [Clostridium tyrobutyricum]MBV4438450.1 hypothetical protein [Clostridium tyrobutyricum]
MVENIIDIEKLKKDLLERNIDDKDGLYNSNLKIGSLIKIVQEEDESLALDMENTIIDYIYKIAVEFYNTGFDDARLFLKQFIN